MKPPVLPEEPQRLQTLERYQVLDTPEEPAFDDLVKLAGRVCGAPIALVSLVDRDRQWFKARFGMEARETPRDHSFCAHALAKPTEAMVVEDALEDPRFRDNPLVQRDPNIRFYAGVPLVAPDGQPLGSFCVIDRVPRRLSEEQLQMLDLLAREAMAQLELRRKSLEMERLVRQYKGIMDTLVEGVLLRDGEGRLVAGNPSAERLLGVALEPLFGQPGLRGVQFVREDGTAMPQTELPSFETLHSGRSHQGVVFGVRDGEEVRWLEANTRALFDPGGAAPSGVVISFWDLSDRKRLEDRLRSEAAHDGLTGLPNRRAFEGRLAQAMAVSARHGTPLSLCACDLDHFKQLNDTQGHGAGDAVLQAFAGALRAELRAEDLPARLGGDEFCILFEGIAAAQAAQSVERVRRAFAAAPQPGDPPKVTATFGLADWRPGLDAAAFAAAADEALYRAKARGRDCIQVFQG